MQIFVKTPPGATIMLPVSPDYTILNVKWMIEGKTGIHHDEQRLISGGSTEQQFDDGLLTLDECGISHDAKLIVQLNIDGGAKKVMKDDKMAMSKAKLEQCMRLVRLNVAVKPELVSDSDAIVRKFFSEQDPDFLKSYMQTMAVEKLRELYDNSIVGDPDSALIKLAPYFIDEISEIDSVVQNLNNVKTCLIKGFVMQYGLEFFVKNQYEHSKFYAEIEAVIKLKDTKSNEDRIAEAIKIREVEIRRAVEQEFLEKMKQMQADSSMTD